MKLAWVCETRRDHWRVKSKIKYVHKTIKVIFEDLILYGWNHLLTKGGNFSEGLHLSS